MEPQSPIVTNATSSRVERGELLVGIINHPRDLEIAREQLWYRVPVVSAPKRWPPQWIAFYLPKIFGNEAFSVRCYGRVVKILRVRRRELFPDEQSNPNMDREYY